MRRISMAVGAFFGIGMTLVFAVMLSSVPPPKAPQLEQEAQHFEVVERRAPVARRECPAHFRWRRHQWEDCQVGESGG